MTTYEPNDQIQVTDEGMLYYDRERPSLPQMTGRNYLRGRTRLRGCKHLTKLVKDDDISYMFNKPKVHTKNE